MRQLLTGAAITHLPTYLFCASQLWLQERTSAGGMSHKKVPRLYKWSDVLTHHFIKSEAEHHFPRLGVYRAEFETEDLRGVVGARPEGGFGRSTRVGDIFSGFVGFYF